ncbi:MAG: hypothetical protein OSB73_05765 [Candidatus Latescibacteria bacterium]|jgi:FKBP-type peptidyl-prolyl cis-trans isomerase|nr:hypothetical protein [Candidatus Latescibacterota bacterium]
MRALALLLLVAGCVGSGKTFSTESGLSYTVITKGSGPAARASQHVSIHEGATFTDGCTLQHARRPIGHRRGRRRIVGMRVGERRKMLIPPTLSKRGGATMTDA